MNDMINNFETTLKENGYKLTVQRRVILNLLIEHEEKHLSTEEIYELVKKKYPQIGLATVYRTLMLFDKLGLIYKLDFDDGFSRYELNKREADHRHHHLICTQCGNVEEVREDLLDSIEEDILFKNGFLVKDHRVKFYGLCKHCRESTDE
ncbi:MAG: transcriptional repressor [Firmicutes bacterium]|nr:transcriptional repressor [Bacillota bacterium]